MGDCDDHGGIRLAVDNQHVREPLESLPPKVELSQVLFHARERERIAAHEVNRFPYFGHEGGAEPGLSVFMPGRRVAGLFLRFRRDVHDHCGRALLAMCASKAACMRCMATSASAGTDSPRLYA